MKYPPINLLNKHLLIGGFMKEKFHECFGTHDDTQPGCRTCIYAHQCRSATQTKSISDHQKVMEAAKPTEKNSLTLYVTEIEICDEIGNRDAKISLSDGDCVQVNIDTYHTLSSWRELSALVEQGMKKMGIDS